MWYIVHVIIIISGAVLSIIQDPGGMGGRDPPHIDGSADSRLEIISLYLHNVFYWSDDQVTWLG